MAKRHLTDHERQRIQELRRAVGRHLRAIREVLGLGQAEFGRRAGLEPNTYNRIEKGHTLPSIFVAMALCDAHGLTLDYIYRGDPSDLSAPVRRALEATAVARSTTQARGSQ